MSDSHELSQISSLMGRLVAANEKYMRSQLRLVFLPYAGSRSPGGLAPNERVTIAIPRKGEGGTPPAGAYLVPRSAMQDCSESDFWGAVGVASESGESGRLVLLISGGLASDEAAEEFNRLAAESGRLYQTLPPSLAPIHGTTSPRNLWAAVLYGWLRETRWVGEEDGFEFVGLPFAASTELWRRLLYGTTPDGRVGAASSPSKPQSPAEVLRMNQLGDPSRIPHSLSVAHANLIEALTRSGDLYQRELRFSNPAPVLDAMERFVHELELIPACFQELLRRSSLVEGYCGSGSPYHNARQAALTSHAGTLTNLSGAKLAIEKVRSDSTEHPLFLQEVVDTRKAIERLLADRQTAGLSPNAVAAFQSWGAECRDIQLEAERLHVDGCWYLIQIYQSSEAAPSERAQTARAILQTDMGGAHLGEIGLAVDSMLAWSIENASPTLESQSIAAGIEVDGSPVVDEPLGERCQLALIAMLELGATDSDHRRSTEEIATKALGSQADANALKNVMSELNTRELIDSKPGRGGGCWLTGKGRARAEKLRKV